MKKPVVFFFAFFDGPYFYGMTLIHHFPQFRGELFLHPTPPRKAINDHGMTWLQIKLYFMKKHLISLRKHFLTIQV